MNESKGCRFESDHCPAFIVDTKVLNNEASGFITKSIHAYNPEKEENKRDSDKRIG